MKLWRYGQSVEYLGRRYRLDGMLGSGGMADVCLAWDEREQREVALKILKSDDLDQETLNRFMKEAAQIAHWQHPHIVRVFESLQVELIDAASGSVLFYMVSEYARGGDLQKRLTPGRPFPLSASFTLFRQLCDAVQYAHERGVIHRDLKPLNILFRRPASGPEEVVLSDFGLAVQVDASHHTFAHGGTLAYMAPEQFQGHAQPASDIFALGVILYLLCTGYLPFRRSLRDMPRIVQGQIPPPTRPSLLNTELPPALDEIMLRTMRELPAERYRQPRELWEAIELALTMSAQTFPFNGSFAQIAGQTWPYDGAESAQGFRQADQQEQSSLSASHPGEVPPEIEEGPVSALWIAREKQKASPVRLPLPDNSILTPPNLPAEDAREQLPSEPAAPISPSTAAFRPRSPARREDEVDEPPPRAGVARASRFSGKPVGDGSYEETGDPQENDGRRPMASLSGSLILPRPRTQRGSEERTSRRNPFYVSKLADDDDDEQEQQTSRRQPTPRFPPSAESQAGRRRVTERDSYGATASQAFGSEAQAGVRKRTPGSARSASPIPRQARPGARAALAPSRAPAPIQQRPRGARGQAQFARTDRAGSPALRRRRVPLAVALGSAAVLLLLVAIVAAATFQGNLLTFFGAPVTTVTLQPRSSLVQESVTLFANTTGTGGPLAPDEISARQISVTSAIQSATANATGSIPAKRATGQLTFINNGSTDVTIQSTTIEDNNGVQISFQGPITIPAAPPSSAIVTGFAVQAGQAGDIPVLDIVKQCCATNIVVKNTSAFTGGQDARPNSVIQQKDIDGAVQGLSAHEQAQALNSVRAQVQSDERIAGDAQCQPQSSANHKAGDVAAQVTVQVEVTCSAIVYNLAAVRQSLARALQQKATALGPAYALSGGLALALISVTPAGANGAQETALLFRAQGRWVYQFATSTLSQWTTLIAGKSQDAARALLLRQPGVLSAQISTSGSLPVNTGEIRINVGMPAPAPPIPNGTPI